MDNGRHTGLGCNGVADIVVNGRLAGMTASKNIK